MAVMNLPNVEFLLIAGRAVFLVFSFLLAAVTFTAWRRATRRQTEEVLARTQRVLDRLGGIAGRLDATDHCITQIVERLDQSATRSTPGTGASPGYEIAIRLARGGATSEELVAGCGLTRAEAELVRRLHGPPLPELRQVS